jgi:hypothetical protein
MPTAASARLEYEAGQDVKPIEALTDSGDATTFTSSASLWSNRSGFAPVITPDGLKTGGVIVPAVSAMNDDIDISAATADVGGVEQSVSAVTDTAITRAATDVACINSVTITNAAAFAVVKGTDSSDATFSETRGAAGGPPFVAVTSIEIGQVRVTSNTTNPIAASEIFQVVGVHQERADFPLFNVNIGAGSVTFLSALPLIHTGSVPKGVSAQFSEPIFAEVSLASDFVPPETSHTVSSTQIYNSTLGAVSSTLNAGSFTAFLNDGVSDGLVTLKNEILWFRFSPDRFKTPNILANGTLGISRTFPADDNIAAACTVNAQSDAVEQLT